MVSRRHSSRCLTAALATLGLTVLAPASVVHAQAPALGTVGSFAVLGASTVTNTGPTILSGTAANLGVSPGSSITGFFAVDGDRVSIVSVRRLS